MTIVLITALGVGLSTVIGALIGFLFKNISHRVSDYILAFAGGVMLSAAFFGLILPSFNEDEPITLVTTIIGIFTGAIVVFLADKLVPHLHRTAEENDIEPHRNSSRMNKVLLFVSAIAIHNIPEGIAAGVGFGGDDITGAITIALGIALQNIPEGMVIIAPMLSVGISKRKTLLIAALTGLAEVVGTLLGYFATGISSVLPFALAFAGGTMLYIVSDEMIPETHAHGNAGGSTFALLGGFVLMMIVDALL